MSHQPGREFRVLYLWLQAMLRRVSQKELGTACQGSPQRWPSVLCSWGGARETMPSDAQGVTMHGGSLGAGEGVKVQHGM